MPFGGLSPLPFRFGGSAEEGWKAEQHARLALDISAQLLMMPLAVIDLSVDAAGVVTVNGILSRAGTDKTIITCAYDTGTSELTMAFPASFVPPGSNSSRKWRPVRGTAFFVDANVLEIASSGSSLFVFHTRPFRVLIEAFGDVEPTDPHEYGTDEDKRNSKTEGDSPYAYWILQDIIRDRGTAYTTDPGRLVTMENIADARLWACARRIAERHACNQSPATAGQDIYRWAKMLGVPRGNDAEWQLRERCVHKAAFRSTAGNAEKMESELGRVLGAAFVSIDHHFGTLVAPPTPTYWPNGTPGPESCNLGPGTWLTDRSRVTVNLQHVSGTTDQQIENAVEIEARWLFDGVLPSWCIWDWAFEADEGFLLGTDYLGRNSL